MQAQDTLVKSQSFINNITVGARIGASIATMFYSDILYQPYERGYVANALGGINADIQLVEGFSVRPELSVLGRGARMQYMPYYLDYKLTPIYFDIRIPFVYTFMHDKKVRPFIAVGPTFDFAIGGRSKFSRGENSIWREVYDIQLGNGSIRRFDLGLYGGLGCQVLVTLNEYDFLFGGEFGYNLGFLNTFAKNEVNNVAHAVNSTIYDVAGTRKNGNFEVSVSFGFPLSNLTKKRKPKPEPIVEPVVVVDTVPAPDTTKKYFSIEEKDCYSLDEMLTFITLKQDISDKKICAFEDLQFDFGKATIRKDSEGYLKGLLRMLYTLPKMNIAIYGHTDNIGSDEYNIKLSQDRAKSVADYLIERGIEPERLKCYGFGARQPLETNDTEEGRARNRRVEIDILNIE